jgi:hypothetical protein
MPTLWPVVATLATRKPWRLAIIGTNEVIRSTDHRGVSRPRGWHDLASVTAWLTRHGYQFTTR